MEIVDHSWGRYKVVFLRSRNEYGILEAMPCIYKCEGCLFLSRQVRLKAHKIVDKGWVRISEDWHCCLGEYTILKLRGDSGDDTK